MRNILYFIALVLLIFWAVGFFVYSAGAIIHLLAVLAVISLLLRILQKDDNTAE